MTVICIYCDGQGVRRKRCEKSVGFIAFGKHCQPGVKTDDVDGEEILTLQEERKTKRKDC